MVNLEVFQLPRDELEGRLRWYEKRYGPYVSRRGLSNWKNLFRKPNLLEWTILFMLILGLFMGWAYQRDLNECHYMVTNLPDIACRICEEQVEKRSQFLINEENLIESGG